LKSKAYIVSIRLALKKERLVEKPTVERFRELLPLICDEATSADPRGWTSQNPLWGHCAVVSLAAQALFGGKLIRGSLEGTPFAKMRSHYWNQWEDQPDPVNPRRHGRAPLNSDFTAAQFGDSYPINPEIGEERSREYLLSNSETKKRYHALMWRLGMELSGDSAFFKDWIYRKCFNAAIESSCKKMKFGCVVVNYSMDDPVIVQTSNGPPLIMRQICEPECLRDKIQSRTDQMLGACDHAEEWAMREVIRKGIRLRDCILYIAGFRNDCVPYIKQVAEHTCLRCSSQIYRYGIGKVAVPVKDHWEYLTGEECVKTALPYSLGEKKA